MAMLTAARRRRTDRLHPLTVVIPAQRSALRPLRVRSQERALRRDAEGEAKVAAMLSQLDDRWRVLHGVAIAEAAGIVDHVVIGPGGVFVLTSRHHPGSSVLVAGDLFMVDGRRHTYTDAARRDAAAARLRLAAASGFEVPVTGVVVPVGADDFVVKRHPADVAVVPRARITRWLTQQPALLTPQQVDDVHASVRKSNICA